MDEVMKLSPAEFEKLVTKLMIKHNLGVSIDCIYEIKKIDSDFFAEEL